MYAIAWILPNAFMKTSSIPILKNKMVTQVLKCNYRPIAVVVAMLKIFELCLSGIMVIYLFTSDNHFGFKQKTLY